MPAPDVKPPPDRLYGRQRTHALRPRQRLLLDVTLPRLRFDPAAQFGADPPRPDRAFAAGAQADPETPRAVRLGRASSAAAGPDLASSATAPPGPVLPGAAWPGPLWLEIGFGGGEHARATAAAHPEALVVAAEVFEQGLCSMLAALVPEGAEATAPLPANLRLWDEDARVLLRALPDASLDRLFLLFPDPWPKARHAKRRFVHPETVALVAAKLRPGAAWRIATDDPTYQAWTIEVMQAATALFAPAEPVADRPADWPPTRYEAKARAAGRQPLYWIFRRL